MKAANVLEIDFEGLSSEAMLRKSILKFCIIWIILGFVSFTLRPLKGVQVGNGQEKEQSERNIL